MSNIYQFKAENLQGESQSLKDYEGEVLLIVNTASKCGFTPQLEGMTALFEKYKDQGFKILAFPSNDFAGQEPLEGEAIQQFCQTKYEAEYPIFNKIHVKGKEAHPLYQFLADKKKNGSVNSKPRWNFHKGEVVDYFMTITKPMSGKIQRAVEGLL